MTQLEQISEHVYWLPPDSRTDRPSLAAVAGRKRTLMLDAGNSPAHVALFLEGLAAHGLAQPYAIVLTHWHWDHSFGAQALSVPLIAHRLTTAELKVQAGYDWSDAALEARVRAGLEIEFCATHIRAEWPDRSNLHVRVPDVTFDGRLLFDLGGVTCAVEHVGGDHAADSCVMLVPEDRVLFLGDCLYDAIYAPQRYYTTSRLFPLLDIILHHEAERFIEGHGEQVASRAEMQTLARDLRVVGLLVEQHGPDRDAILAALPAALGRVPTADDLEFVDNFLNGLPERLA